MSAEKISKIEKALKSKTLPENTRKSLEKSLAKLKASKPKKVVVKKEKKETPVKKDYPKNLSQFKKYLKSNIGKPLYLVIARNIDKPEKAYIENIHDRKIATVQSNSFSTSYERDGEERESWIDYGSSKDWSFKENSACVKVSFFAGCYYYEKPTKKELITRISELTGIDFGDEAPAKKEPEKKNVKIDSFYNKEVIDRAKLVYERQSETPVKKQLELYKNEMGYYTADIPKILDAFIPEEKFSDFSPKYSLRQLKVILWHIYNENLPSKMDHKSNDAPVSLKKGEFYIDKTIDSLIYEYVESKGMGKHSFNTYSRISKQNPLFKSTKKENVIKTQTFVDDYFKPYNEENIQKYFMQNFESEKGLMTFIHKAYDPKQFKEAFYDYMGATDKLIGKPKPADKEVYIDEILVGVKARRRNKQDTKDTLDYYIITPIDEQKPKKTVSKKTPVAKTDKSDKEISDFLKECKDALNSANFVVKKVKTKSGVKQVKRKVRSDNAILNTKMKSVAKTILKDINKDKEPERYKQAETIINVLTEITKKLDKLVLNQKLSELETIKKFFEKF